MFIYWVSLAFYQTFQADGNFLKKKKKKTYFKRINVNDTKGRDISSPITDKMCWLLQ